MGWSSRKSQKSTLSKIFLLKKELTQKIFGPGDENSKVSSFLRMKKILRGPKTGFSRGPTHPGP